MKPEIQKQIYEQLERVILENNELDFEIIYILNLIKEAHLYKYFFTKEYRNQIKPRLYELNRSNILDEQSKEFLIKATNGI